MLYNGLEGRGEGLNINELAKISGVSVRTLHHYDRIRLLCPARDPDNDYRVYGEREVDRLQQVLLFRACGFIPIPRRSAFSAGGIR